MTERNETLVDIVAEMRDMAADAMTHGTIVAWGQYSTVLINFADRIDAAAGKRQTVAGNASKLREAADKVHYLFADYLNTDTADRAMLHHMDIVEAALAAPPRNCAWWLLLGVLVGWLLPCGDGVP